MVDLSLIFEEGLGIKRKDTAAGSHLVAMRDILVIKINVATRGFNHVTTITGWNSSRDDHVKQARRLAKSISSAIGVSATYKGGKIIYNADRRAEVLEIMRKPAKEGGFGIENIQVSG